MAMIVAEIGTSHEGNEKKAFELIDCAVSSGCDAVKFQWVYADEILHPKTGFVNLPTGKIPLYERFKQLECSPEFYEKMKNYAHSKGVKFICSPFGIKSLHELIEIKPDFIKIASPELNHFPMLKELSHYDFPIIISSGVSVLADIENALSILKKNDVFLLHCITSYPAPESEYNLKLIENLARIFGIPVGVSDHSLNPILVPVLSIMCGAKIIEKHITLSRKNSGLDDPVALEGEQFALMVHCVHQAECVLNRYGYEKGRTEILKQLGESYDEKLILSVLGDGVKKLAQSEEKNYGRTNRSLHYTKDLAAGTCVSFDDIAVLRTEKVLSPGISPCYLDTVCGFKLCKNVRSGDGVQFCDFMSKN